MSRLTVASGYAYETEYGYSRAVRVGEQVWVSGTTARDEALEGDVYVQSLSALAIAGRALAEAGLRIEDTVRTVVYMLDLDEAPLVARAHREVFGDIRPASTLVEVSRLTPARARVEFEITAASGAPHD